MLMVLALVMLVVSALVSVVVKLEVALVPVAATAEGATMAGSGWRCGW